MSASWQGSSGKMGQIEPFVATSRRIRISPVADLGARHALRSCSAQGGPYAPACDWPVKTASWAAKARV